MDKDKRKEQLDNAHWVGQLFGGIHDTIEQLLKFARDEKYADDEGLHGLIESLIPGLEEVNEVYYDLLETYYQKERDSKEKS